MALGDVALGDLLLGDLLTAVGVTGLRLLFASCGASGAGLWSLRVISLFRPGRVSFFTSGSENLHRVEKVHWGTRYAVTIAFTCNPDHGIADPAFT